MKEKKIKENKETIFLVKKAVEEFIQDGVRHIRYNWFKQDMPLNLGSMNNPQNKDIVEIKYEIPEGKKKF